MEISYKSHRLARTVKDLSSIAKAYGTRAKLVNKRLKELKSAKDLSDFKYLPQANCHELNNNRKGELAIDISANHRIIFIPNHEPIPQNDDGGMDWSSINSITITVIGEDYH